MEQDPDDRWDRLARTLSHHVAAFVPEWTDRPDADPGVTLAELLGFLGESLLARDDAPPGARKRVRAIIRRLDRLQASPCRDTTLTRVRYASGQLLTAADLERDQEYHRARHRRHNRLLHGVGVVDGLGVSLQPGPGGAQVVVEPGLAISGEGEELLLCAATTVALPDRASSCHVTIGLLERETGHAADGVAMLVEESAGIEVRDDVPPGHVAIARLAGGDGAWAVDAGYVPPRAPGPPR